MKKKLEIACFDLDSALIAAGAGAHRLEFCDHLQEGGTSPSIEKLNTLLSKVQVPVFVMVRPRGGNFIYSPQEFEHMCTQLLAYKAAGAGGFVFGCLTPHHQVDLEMNAALTALAHPLPCTFHRAIDHTPDLLAAVETVAGLGFKRVLTSGGKGNAMDHVDRIKELVERLGDQIGILPGGGIRSSNITALLHTQATEFHSSGITPATHPGADAKEIRKILDALA